MPLTFVAIASQDRSLYTIASTVRVFKATADGMYVPVACIDDSADPADHRHTEVTFAEGRLSFKAAYDGPILDHFIWPFADQNNRTNLELHDFPRAQKSYFCSKDGFYPIKKDYDRQSFTITIYSSTPIPREDGMLFSTLATIKETKKDDNGFQYVIQAEENIPISLLMAIFSLPFTLLNIC